MGTTVYATVVRKWEVVGGSDLADRLDEFADMKADICTVYCTDGGIMCEIYGRVAELRRALREHGLQEVAALLDGLKGEEEVSIILNVLW